MGLRNYIDDKIAPHFHEGGKLEKYYVFFEMFDTMLYSPDSVTRSAAHVRDGIDLKRIMMTVWFATFPAILFGLYNTGYQANLQITEFGYDAIPGWRADLVAMLAGFDYQSFWANMLHGLVYYVPILATVYLTGFFWEALFAWKRGHEVNEGFFVTGILFTLILPPAIPLWQVVLGVSFGVVIGKEVFGGTGKNFLNPALVGRAFLYFAYPAQMSGDAIWTAVDNFSGATPLSLAASGDLNFAAGLGENKIDISEFRKGEGCVACKGRGYQGRLAVLELMSLTPELRSLIAGGRPAMEIRKQALTQGLTTLWANGMDKVAQGKTTVEEVLRVCVGED